jgi:hypothetical protein
MKSDAHKEIVRHSRGLKGTKVVVTSTSQSTITRPTVRAHNLDSATRPVRYPFQAGLLRNDHCRHKSGNIAKLPFAIRLAPGK